ncbi:uncharacterized protein LOC144658891 [Oculina patagonica]
MSASINVHEQETSDTSFSSSGGQKPLIHHERNRFVVALVIITSLLLIWGVSLLPTIFYANKLSVSVEQQESLNTSNQTMPMPRYPCSQPLVLNKKTKMCEPPCPWVTLTSAEDFALKVVDNFSIAVSLLGFVIILATWIRIKQLRCFPHVIPLCIQGLSAAICFLLAVANGIGREKAFCRSKFYMEAEANPTKFCTAQGMLIHYFSVALALWFVVYSINLLQMICSDSLVSLQGKTYQVKRVVCSLVCWLLPCIPVGIVLGSKSTSYVPLNMRLCFPNGTDIGFYTTTFITEVSQGVGCTCLFFVVYKLFTLRDISTVIGEQAKLRKKKMDKVVKRLVFLMFAYAVITALTYIPICALQQHSKLLEYYTKQYFGCLMFFPPDHCPRTYEKYTFSSTFVVSTLSSAFFAMTTVCFLAFNKQSRKLWSFWWFRLQGCCGGNSQ